jgi:hypothetical protein
LDPCRTSRGDIALRLSAGDLVAEQDAMRLP